MDEGDTVTLAELPAELLHAKVEIVPLPALAFAVSVVLVPAQKVEGVADGETVGFAFKVTAMLPVAEQLLLFVTVTV